MINHKQDDGRMIQGTPRDLINMLSREITDALNKSNVGASGIQALAMLHVAACLVREIQTRGDMGHAPALKSILSVIMRGLDGSSWTNEELHAFDEDFCKIVESLGGQRLPEKETGAMFMGPSLGVH